jgi:hypothetical protein
MIRINLPFDELWSTRGSSHITTILSNPRSFDFESMKSMVLKRILGLPDKVVKVSNQDTSGVGIKPFLGSDTPACRRINYLERKATRDFSRPASHAAFVGQSEKNIYQWVNDCKIGAEWIVYSDLYTFVRDLVFKTTSDVFFGPHLLQ